MTCPKSDLTDDQRGANSDQTQPEPEQVTRPVEGVGRDHVEHQVAEVGGQGDHVEQDVTDRQELDTHLVVAFVVDFYVDAAAVDGGDKS